MTSSGSGRRGATPSSPSLVVGSLPYSISSRAASFFASTFVESNSSNEVGLIFFPSTRVLIDTGVVLNSHERDAGSGLSFTLSYVISDGLA